MKIPLIDIGSQKTWSRKKSQQTGGWEIWLYRGASIGKALVWVAISEIQYSQYLSICQRKRWALRWVNRKYQSHCQFSRIKSYPRSAKDVPFLNSKFFPQLFHVLDKIPCRIFIQACAPRLAFSLDKHPYQLLDLRCRLSCASLIK